MRHHVYKLFFHCELVGGAPAENFETEGAEFFSQQELPSLSLTRVVPAQVDRLFKHNRHPYWQTDFD